jgi:hemerythrin-like domain-containing protein
MTQQAHSEKRSGKLAPLSQEHGEGLLFVKRIRQGIANRIMPDTIAAYCIWYWKYHIKPHFRHEEDILMAELPKDNDLVKRMCAEHETIRELMLSLDKEADRPTLTHLANLIHDHIYFEEDELFRHIERVLPAESLEKIHQQLEQKPLPHTVEWPDKFWEIQPIDNNDSPHS